MILLDVLADISTLFPMFHHLAVFRLAAVFALGKRIAVGKWAILCMAFVVIAVLLTVQIDVVSFAMAVIVPRTSNAFTRLLLMPT
jgi:hypothetical protein